MNGRTIEASLAIWVLLAAGPAFADMVPMPPGCPHGARGVTSHAGARCHALPCASDGDCTDGTTCRPYRVCVRNSTVPPAGRGAFISGAAPHLEELVVGSCEVSQQCGGDEEEPPPVVGTLAPGPPTCRDGSYCVLPTLPPLPSVAERAEPPPVVSPGNAGQPSSNLDTGVVTSGGCQRCSFGQSTPTAGVSGLVFLLILLGAARRRFVR